MLGQILDLALRSAEGAFTEVGAFVGAVLLLFGYINYKHAGALVAFIARSKGWQPLLGALLGLTPGCGGAIFIMPLFFRGSVTFGAVVATLIATMGDSSFVLIATHPLHYLIISGLSLGVAVVTGHIVDNTNVGNRLLAQYQRNKKRKDQLKQLHSKANHTVSVAHIGHGEGDDIDIALHHNLRGHPSEETLAYKLTHQGYPLYWALLAGGLILGVLGLFQVEASELGIPNLGLIVGVTGTLLSIAFTILSKKFLDNDTHEEAEHKVTSLKETLVHNAQETAFVISWVFVGFLAYELLVFTLGRGDYAAGELLVESLLLAAGVASVVVGGMIGLIPGCGPQIIFVALFSRGLVPFAALLANSISQDGDALLPLLALDRRSAIWASIITTIPAILFGLVIYWLEINTRLLGLIGL